MSRPYSLDQMLLQIAVHTRQELDYERPRGGIESNKELLSSIATYAKARELPSAGFIARMLETYLESTRRV